MTRGPYPYPKNQTGGFLIVADDRAGGPVCPGGVSEDHVAVLRFPGINQYAWYRVLEIADHRGDVPKRVRRLARFLSQQELDPATGHVIGQWDTACVDGGMTLARGYALTEEFGEDRFWDDLKEVYRAGFAEQVVKPAPGRRAVYALCLRVDSIPRDLPDDLAQQLKVWDLPEVEVRHEDARYGRMAAEATSLADTVPIELNERQAAELATAPRWEHPSDSPAAVAAEAIRTSAKTLGAEAGPQDLRCWAVADRDRAEALTQRVLVNGKTSPSYAKGFSPLSGLSSTGSRELSWSNKMEQATTTPSAAAGNELSVRFGDDPGAVADRVLRRAWHSWRTQLGHGKVILPNGSWDERGQWHSASAWSDLQRTVRIALRRSTEGELIELLSGNVAGVEDVGKLAAWRLWRLINSRKDAHGYGRRRDVAQAAHVTAWDEADAAERARLRVTASRDRKVEHLHQAPRPELVDGTGRGQRERWNLDRWAREPEHVHQQKQAERESIESSAPRSADSTRAAALARARAEKRARRSRDRRMP